MTMRGCPQGTQGREQGDYLEAQVAGRTPFLEWPAELSLSDLDAEGSKAAAVT